MRTGIKNGKRMKKSIFSTESFEPKAIEISTPMDLYKATADILEMEFKTVKEAKQFIDESGVTKTGVIFRDILSKILFRNGSRYTPFIILKESFHMNKVYYDSYSSHLSGKHFPLNHYCNRLFFLDLPQYSDNIFDMDESVLSELLIGTCVIRPSLETENILGQTLLNPIRFKNLKNEYICTAQYRVTMFGKRLAIAAFPYMMQDGEVITCAETTLIHLLDYFSNRYSSYRSVLPSDIFQIEKELSFERLIPSKGMTYQTVSHILTKLNFHPKLYGFATKKTIDDKRIMHHYIDSAIPVAVSLTTENTVESHSVVAIGIKNNILSIDNEFLQPQQVGDQYFLDIADIHNEYIIMNDSSAPYANMTIVKVDEEENEPNGSKFKVEIKNDPHKFQISSLIAPLEKRMYLDDYNAAQIAINIISHDVLGIKNVFSMMGLNEYQDLGDDKNNPIIYRLLLVRAGSFRRKRSYGLNKKTLRWKVYSSIPLPKFIWVCELYSYSSLKRNKAIGEIVIDATATEMDGVSSAILINYPHRFAYRTPQENFKTFLDRYSEKQQNDWQEIQPYVHFKEPEKTKLFNLKEND